MFETTDYLIAICLLLGAVLYTSVGHAGASAYIAIMSLFGVSAPVIKPTALALNILVSSYTSYKYIKSNLFDIRLTIPLLIGAIPTAYIGGHLTLPSHIYKPLVGIILLYSSYKFIFIKSAFEGETKQPNKILVVLIGAVIGFLSGLTGTGGGIFLSPLILFLGWTSVRGASGTASVFILFNSIFGLLGNLSSVNQLPPTLPLYATSVLIGAFIGTKFGIKYFSHLSIKRALGVVLLIAGLKLTLNL